MLEYALSTASIAAGPLVTCRAGVVLKVKVLIPRSFELPELLGEGGNPPGATGGWPLVSSSMLLSASRR